MRAPLLTTAGLVLDPPRLGDAEDWCAAQDDECARWFDWPCRPSLERCRAHLELVVHDDLPDTAVWAIRTPNGLAGGIDLTRLDDRWNVSYFVAPAHRGHGLATAALRLMCSWAIDELGADAVTTRVHIDNLASQRVLEKAGFRCTGERANEVADHLDLVYELTRPRPAQEPHHGCPDEDHDQRL